MTHRTSLGIVIAVMAGCGAFLPGCSMLSAPCASEGTGSVTLASRADGGPPTSVAVEIAIATDETLAVTLSGLSGVQWFQQRTQLLKDNPETLQTAGWEIVLGQSVAAAPVQTPCGVVAIYAYASYTGPGEHRMKLPDLEKVTLVLDSNQMTRSQ
jgi:type VI secretion system protein